MRHDVFRTNHNIISSLDDLSSRKPNSILGILVWVANSLTPLERREEYRNIPRVRGLTDLRPALTNQGGGGREGCRAEAQNKFRCSVSAPFLPSRLSIQLDPGRSQLRYPAVLFLVTPAIQPGIFTPTALFDLLIHFIRKSFSSVSRLQLCPLTKVIRRQRMQFAFHSAHPSRRQLVPTARTKTSASHVVVSFILPRPQRPRLSRSGPIGCLRWSYIQGLRNCLSTRIQPTPDG